MGESTPFSLKVSLDPRNWAAWSDHDGLVYAATPQPSEPLVVPAVK